MKTVTLTVKKQPELFLEADCINPDAFAGKTAEDCQAPVYQGKEISRSATSSLSRASRRNRGRYADRHQRRLHQDEVHRGKMTAGEMVVNGTTDMYTGAWMKGGKLLVTGNVHSFCGLGMEGGEFIIDGNAGNYLAASYRGDWRGMRAGLLRVKGNAGSDICTFMNGGTLIIEGNADIHIGTHAEGGKIIIKGNVNRRVGGQMVKGEMILFGTVNVMMPGYKYVRDVEMEVDGTKAKFAEFIGDLGERHPKRKGETVYGKFYMKV